MSTRAISSMRAIPALAENPLEKRSGRRQRVLLAGKILFGSVVADCTIKDLSGAGARLQVPGVIGLPDEVFVLILREGLVVRARRVWMRAPYAGIKFLAAEDIEASQRSHCAPLRKVWKDWLASQTG